MHALSHSPHRGTGEKIWRVKVRKLMSWDWGSSTGKVKAVLTSKAEQGINSLLPINRQMFSHCHDSRTPWCRTFTWEGKYGNSKHPPLFFLSFPQLLVLIMLSWVMTLCVGHPFGHLGSAVLAVSPPKLWCTPCLLSGRTVWEQKRPWCCASTVEQ